MSIDFDIVGAGIDSPGLPDWPSLIEAFAGTELDDRRAASSTLLSPRERRRAPATVNLSFAAAEQACAMAGIAPGEPVAVFSSGMGDLDITDYMCRLLAEEPALLSPTRFHNSVHNAASGYWSIGANATGDVTAISGWRDSASAGLLEALARLGSDGGPVLLVVYDDKAVGPMRDLWPSEHPFSAALVLVPAGHANPLARLSAETTLLGAGDASLPPALEARRHDNPAARILPLLGLICGHIKESAALTVEQGTGLIVRNRPA
ncbi:MAG: beta-ketoacyl synthase chain length factor [Wenzhouxiangella sp.]